MLHEMNISKKFTGKELLQSANTSLRSGQLENSYHCFLGKDELPLDTAIKSVYSCLHINLKSHVHKINVFIFCKSLIIWSSKVVMYVLYAVPSSARLLKILTKGSFFLI